MQRDVLLLTEMIDAAEQAQQLASGVTVSQLETDRQRRDALLWNFTVLGEAAGQVSNEVKARSQATCSSSAARSSTTLAGLLPPVPPRPGCALFAAFTLPRCGVAPSAIR